MIMCTYIHIIHMIVTLNILVNSSSNYVDIYNIMVLNCDNLSLYDTIAFRF